MSMKRDGKIPGKRQRGLVLFFTVFGLGLLVAMLAVADIGVMYHYKREYQKAADLAALSGVKRLISRVDGSRNCAAAGTAATANAGTNLTEDASLGSVECGLWEPAGKTAPACELGSSDARLDTSDPTQANAVRAVVTGTPPNWFLSGRTLTACATALTDIQDLAQLTIRSTLASVSTAQSTLLNGVVGGLLGGSIDLNAVGWNGLLNTDINLLQYLDMLALELGVDVGDYDSVLEADATLGQLLDVAAVVLDQSGNTTEIDAAIAALGQLTAVQLPGFQPLLQLGELIGVSTGLPASAFDLGLNLLDLVQGGAMLATGDSVATIDLPVVNIPGVTTVTAKIKVIEPPVKSAVGNPQLAKADPYGPDQIFVRTAQIRTLISADLGDVSGLVNQLNNVVMPLLSPIVDFLNTTVLSSTSLIDAVGSLLGLLENILTGLGCVLGCETDWTERNVAYVKALAQPLQISLDAAGANGHVYDYSCIEEKSLEVPAQASLAHLRIGRISTENIFDSDSTPKVDPVSIIEIGYREVHARRTCGALWSNCKNEQEWRQEDGSWGDEITAERTVIAGLGIKVDAPIGQAPTPPTLVYMPPNLPEIGEEPAYLSIKEEEAIIESLTKTLHGITIQAYHSEANGLLGGILNGTINLLNSVINGLQGVIGDVLAKALDPVLNRLLPTLGIDLAPAEIGANLSCAVGSATLVD